jgi:hypothetical protein
MDESLGSSRPLPVFKKKKISKNIKEADAYIGHTFAYSERDRADVAVIQLCNLSLPCVISLLVGREDDDCFPL